MHPAVARFLAEQSGVVAREQAMGAGVTDTEIRRLCRRRELVPVHRGVYVDHTGAPTWQQQAWAAVLACWPAALSHASALRAAEGPGSTRAQPAVEVAVDRHRSRLTVPGVRVHRTGHLEERTQWHLGPPRIRYEEAVLDVASRARSDVDALGELARAVQARRTTALRLAASLAGRERLPRGRWMASVLEDVAAGACSVLEHGYLVRVERAHGLTPARRQVRDRIGAGTIYRDVDYAGGLVVELDGRVHHDTVAARDADMDRDLATAVGRRQTVRISYGQVFDRPCFTAACIATLLADLGIATRARPCGPGCTVGSPVWAPGSAM